MYGEFDPWYVISALKSAGGSRQNGTLTRVGDGTARLQTAYVGNVAWAHLCATRALAEDPGASDRAHLTYLRRTQWVQRPLTDVNNATKHICFVPAIPL